ncbi:hypothetical protein PHYBOEH_010220 [Phytophthora boehmeriae]|uniref:PH domain-containing protein n=1 Tax=Phytophthora boehmeriae TaxID=109152 RepID=A0A8T1VNX8_9STRA|nr:hypothetical protein PHYBOEH_010220 [Phytophthora boehmeriae]
MTGDQRQSCRSNGEGKGVQLLSPTMQQSILNTPSVLSSSHPAESFGWSTTPPASYASPGFSSTDDKKDELKADFDFDGFTLASVRGRGKSQSSRQDRANSASRVEQSNVTDEYCAFYYDKEAPKPLNPLSCSTSSAHTTRTTDDFDMLERSRRLRQSSQRLDQSRFTQSCVDNRSKVFTSATAAAAGWPMAKKKELTAVVMNGWLQKRKGLVIKRWKPYYCLFKSDDSLCLYTSEDTVNGRLEQRYQILRVVLTDKNDSFHIIGVDSDGAPRREEFRAAVSPEWTRWFHVLRRFFDNASLEQAFVRKPELTFALTLDDTFDERSNDNANEVMPSDEGIRHTNFGVNSATGMPTYLDYESYDERRSYVTKKVVRGSFDGMGDDRTSTVSSFSGSSNGQSKGDGAKLGTKRTADCPMIERDSQARVPLLEIRGSETMQDTDATAAA